LEIAVHTKRLIVTGLIATLLAAGCSKPSADALFAKGNEYLEKNLVPEAIVQYRLASQAEPKRGDIRVKMAEAYLRHGDGPNALKQAVIAADLLPNDKKVQLDAGALLLIAGAFEDAKGRAGKVLGLDPQSTDALILMGNAMAGLKDLDGALNQYQEALALNPKGAQAYSNIGAIQFSRGQLPEAEATFRKAIAAAPDAINARLALASFLWAGKRFPEAEAELKAALTLDPQHLGANRALGSFYLATGRGPSAEPYFKKVTEGINTDEAQLALADYYLAMGKTAEAKAILEPLNKKADFKGPAPLRLAAIAEAENNRGLATTIVAKVLEKTPSYAPARVFSIKLLAADGKIEQAITDAQTLIRDEPNAAAASEANLIIGDIELNRDRTDEAIKAYEEVMRIQPQSVPAAMALAVVHLRVGNADRAETYAKQVLAVQPSNPVARSIVVRANLLRNQPDKARAEMASLEKEFPNTVQVLNLRAANELAAGRHDAARALYEKVAATSPENLEALEGLVLVDLAKKRPKDAADRVDAALKRLSQSADLLMISARAHAAAGNLQRTEELLRQAIDKEPARLAAYGALGQLYVHQNRLDDAKDQFTALLARNPRSVAVNTMLGMLLEAKKDVAGAEAQYQKTLGVDGNAAVAANNLAWIYVASNRNLDVAIQLAQTALKSLPEEPHVNDTLGWAYFRKGQIGQAIRHLEMSLSRDQSDAAVHYHAGMAYVSNGDMAKGVKSLQKALAMNQSFEGADEARKTLAEAIKK
jgi:tetratricopeptide (TPR) repeat protein